MSICVRFALLLVLLCWSGTGFSQFKKDTTCTGNLVGIVRDSAHNYVMQSATLAVYRIADGALVSYQLSNNFGEFDFKELSVGTRLRIVASYVGYTDVRLAFMIADTARKLDLKLLNMNRLGEGLADVVVKSVPPVTMNGDTLEFNADAFKMDSNAVAEDLFRRLLGLVVWGDGSVTVYGKTVHSLMVNGKPFFGGDVRVATQNLPKLAVEKVQVYQRNKQAYNLMDSTTEINIQLKKGKDIGHFGKLSAGAGTDRHYESDANINFFTSRTQLGVAGGLNDINKVASDVNTLMRNSTYKGAGAYRLSAGFYPSGPEPAEGGRFYLSA